MTSHVSDSATAAGATSPMTLPVSDQWMDSALSQDLLFNNREPGRRTMPLLICYLLNDEKIVCEITNR